MKNNKNLLALGKLTVLSVISLSNAQNNKLQDNMLVTRVTVLRNLITQKANDKTVNGLYVSTVLSTLQNNNSNWDKVAWEKSDWSKVA